MNDKWMEMYRTKKDETTKSLRTAAGAGDEVLWSIWVSWQRHKARCGWETSQLRQQYNGPCPWCTRILPELEEEFELWEKDPVLVQPQPLWIGPEGLAMYITEGLHTERLRKSVYYRFLLGNDQHPSLSISARVMTVEHLIDQYQPRPAHPWGDATTYLLLLEALEWFIQATVPVVRHWDDDLAEVPGWNGVDYDTIRAA